MNTFEITFYDRRRPITVKADEFCMSDGWVTFFDKSVASDTKIVGIISQLHVESIIRKDEP